MLQGLNPPENGVGGRRILKCYIFWGLRFFEILGWGYSLGETCIS